MVKDLLFDDQAERYPLKAPEAPASGYFIVVASGVVVRGRKDRLERRYGKIVPVGPGALPAKRMPPLGAKVGVAARKTQASKTGRVEITSPAERKADAVSDHSILAAVLNVGVRPGERLSGAKAQDVLKKLAVTATDLFETPAAAETYLEFADIHGERALDLIKVGRTASVLARFDELRYGPQG